MNATRWQAIGDLFEQALPLPVGQRTALLDGACGIDHDLRREVVSLLASHNAAGGFLQHRIDGALSSFYQTTVAGGQPARVGPYRLIRELGRGGMGTVFLAERDDDEYHAQVAVKLVRPGMDTEFILARFRRERQTLARLQHPNISRLLDGGTTEGGLPYFVMEYIDGRWLTDHADHRRLTVDERLRMFIDVCSAVDYAHRNFIIHRDLKPGNILVGPDGVPKLVDFGICKLLRPDALSPNDTVGAPMTPDYASPEQIQGDAVTPLSDIYSLGAVLYQLLTASPPRRFGKLTPLAIEQASRAPIGTPSSVAADKAVVRHLKGDLDNIVMRAVETEPQRRYQSVAQFAEDLRRFLNHEPVHARPQTVRYRAGKFLQRHRIQTIAAAAVFLVLSAALAVSRREARVTSARQQQVRTMADKLVFDVHDAVRDLPGSTKARAVIVRTALDYLDSSINAVQGDGSAEKELAKAYRRLGDVQGEVRTANMGDSLGALARYGQAVTLLDDAIRRAPADLDAITERLVLYHRIGTLHAGSGQLGDAVQTMEAGIGFGRPFLPSNDDDLRVALSALYLNCADARRNLSQYQAAFSDAAEALRLAKAVAEHRPSDPAVRYAVASAHGAVGMAESGRHRLQEALVHLRDGASQLEALVASDPRNNSWERDLMLAYGHVADVLGNPALQNLGDRPGALQEYWKAVDIAKRRYEADRAAPGAAADYGIVLSRLETTMEDRDLSAKLAVQQESIRVLEEAANTNPDDGSVRRYLVLVEQHIGDSYAAAARIGAAHDAYLRSADIASAGIKSGDAPLHILSIQTNGRLALNAVVRRRRGEAIDYAHQALQAGQNPPPGSGTLRALPRGLAVMGLTYAALQRSQVAAAGDRQYALVWLAKSLDAWRVSQSEPGFSELDRREMQDVEVALARAQAPATSHPAPHR
jgi:eukaryotic-like serine/threonine-protein kinase